MIAMTKNTKNVLFIIGLITFAVSWRIINHSLQIAPNLELVTTASLIAAITIGWQAALIVPILTMFLSDIIIGNSSIFMFTWIAFAAIGIGALLLRKLNNNPKSQIIYSIGFATVSSFFFFIVTNFGVWAQGWYPATWAGLSDCFIMAIPFYRTMLIGNIILVPAAVTAWQFVKYRHAVKNLVVNSLVRE
jgi:uncharacterized membrane protein